MSMIVQKVTKSPNTPKESKIGVFAYQIIKYTINLCLRDK